MPSIPPQRVTRTFVIRPTSQQYRAVYSRMLSKQDGLCSHCNGAISNGDTIVSKAYVRSSKYFHEACAQLIKII